MAYDTYIDYPLICHNIVNAITLHHFMVLILVGHFCCGFRLCIVDVSWVFFVNYQGSCAGLEFQKTGKVLELFWEKSGRPWKVWNLSIV